MVVFDYPFYAMFWGSVIRRKLLILNLVDLVGIEPTTSSMPWKRAPSCATGPLWRVNNFYIVSACSGFVKLVACFGNSPQPKGLWRAWHPELFPLFRWRRSAE